MAEVWPFKGIQYNVDAVGDIAGVLAPPFDVISPAFQATLHERHAANVIRLILADETRMHDGAKDRYDSARLYLEDWLHRGSLVQSSVPAIYLLSQEFNFHGRHTRWGFICAITLEELDKGIVIPHEATLDKPKADRLQLIGACEANLSPVFACYFDPNSMIKKTLAGVSDTPPQFEAADDDGVISRLWKVTDRARLDTLHNVMKNHQLFIADGHHRYESALNYRNLMRKKRPGVTNAPWERVMIYLTDFEDPALLAMPIHRSIAHLKGWTVDEFISRLEKSFTVEKLGIDLSDGPDKLLQVMADKRDQGSVIGMALKDSKRPFLIRPREEALKSITDIPEPLKELDIIQLHRLALEEVLEIGEKDLRDGQVILYNHDARAAYDQVYKSDWAAAFFLNRLKVEQIRRVCSAGLRMHQKSTYFYPKIPSGLVFHRLR